jgi:2-amino-4-hydroxy-6-hydroxymethyldihydropteridine diphosphokinase
MLSSGKWLRMASCLIGLGSNLGDRRANLEAAVARLRQHAALRVLSVSQWRETAPVGGPAGQSPFLNGATLVETSLAPHDVLAALQQIEDRLGRRRAAQWGPRSIDLDLLLYEQAVLDAPALVLPHPRMAWRRFVLEPAAEVAGAMLHPTTGWSVARLLEHLNAATPYVAVAGAIGAGKTELAARLADVVGAGRADFQSADAGRTRTAPGEERGLARPAGVHLISETIDMEQLGAFYADPAAHAWATELRFLAQRTRLLAADAPAWTVPPALTVSDFWFDQSLAFARAWLAPGQFAEFRRAWEESRQRVVRPKLIVLLDAPAAELRRQIGRRARPCERGLTMEQLDRIRQAILAQAAEPDQGPILRLANVACDAALAETLAAVQAMQ